MKKRDMENYTAALLVHTLHFLEVFTMKQGISRTRSTSSVLFMATLRQTG